MTYLKGSSHNKVITSQGVVFYQSAFFLSLRFFGVLFGACDLPHFMYSVHVICLICFNQCM